jgi:CubicO group peptidase (beta-lactamase class C family)
MTATAPQLDSLDAAARYWLAHWNVPGLAVGVLRNDEVQTWGYGVASLETGVAVRPDTLFQVGSFSKVFCATLVMTLVDEGRLDLDTPVVEYLPELTLADAQALGALTMRHLLSHTSGIFGDDFSDHGMGDDALAKAVANFGSLRQYTPPGTSWAYCNSGFDLAGRVVEQLLGMPYEQAMRERVFGPLGLERTFFFAHEAIAYSVAVGHTLPDPAGREHAVTRDYYMARRSNPCGGIISTVGDLLAFARFHLGDPPTGSGQAAVGDTRVLSAESIKAMQQEQTKAANFVDAWGIGWDISYVDGVTVIGHGGSTNGFQALLKVVPDRQFAIAMLSNGTLGAATVRSVAEWALEHYCGLRVTSPTTISLSEAQLLRVAGTYTQDQMTGTIAVHNGGLIIDVKAPKEEGAEPQQVLPPITLKPISALEFLAIDGPFAGMRVDFIPGEGDSIRFVRLGGRLADRV